MRLDERRPVRELVAGPHEELGPERPVAALDDLSLLEDLVAKEDGRFVQQDQVQPVRGDGPR
jgi:hypothetical protein